MHYKNKGIPYYRPWLFIITDGHPAEESPEILERAREKLRKSQESKAVYVLSLGVSDQVNLDSIEAITGTNTQPLKSIRLENLFVWLD